MYTQTRESKCQWPRKLPGQGTEMNEVPLSEFTFIVEKYILILHRHCQSSAVVPKFSSTVRGDKK